MPLCRRKSGSGDPEKQNTNGLLLPELLQAAAVIAGAVFGLAVVLWLSRLQA